MQSLEDGTRQWPGAVIVITDASGTAFRPAAFVFDVPGGLAWVEPSYADPAGAASPAFHRRAGSFTAWNAIESTGAKLGVLPYAPGEDADLVGDGLEWFAAWLTAEGRTWAEERERVRAMLGEALA